MSEEREESVEELREKVKALEEKLLEFGEQLTETINSRYLKRKAVPISESMYRLAMCNFDIHNSEDAKERRAAMREVRAEELHQEKLRILKEGKRVKKKAVYASSRIPPMETEEGREVRDLLKGTSNAEGHEGTQDVQGDGKGGDGEGEGGADSAEQNGKVVGNGTEGKGIG